MRTLRRGFSLHEMLISLTVLCVAVATASRIAAGELRFFHGAGEVALVRSQLHEATAIAEAALWGAAPTHGDLLYASDSALEVRVTSGVAVVCAGGVGEVTIPAPSDDGTLAAFDEPPIAGDVGSVIIADSAGASWLPVGIAAAPSAGGACLGFQTSAGTWRVSLREPLTIPTGAVLRIARPLRMSLYRASDRRWYFGVRDWNVAADRLNTIQPVAGPLAPYSADAGSTGLRFSYFDAAGVELQPTIDAAAVATVRVVARSVAVPVRLDGMASTAGGAFSDSSSITVALRNRS